MMTTMTQSGGKRSEKSLCGSRTVLHKAIGQRKSRSREKATKNIQGFFAVIKKKRSEGKKRLFSCSLSFPLFAGFRFGCCGRRRYFTALFALAARNYCCGKICSRIQLFRGARSDESGRSEKRNDFRLVRADNQLQRQRQRGNCKRKYTLRKAAKAAHIFLFQYSARFSRRPCS